jgi:Sec-independent protein translocase protein TatA
VFGIGPQELLVMGLLVLVVFGPTKATSMARDLGRFVSGAQRTVEEFKDELVPEEIEEARHSVKEAKDEVQQSLQGIEDRHASRR